MTTRDRWEVVHDGRVLADADGMHFCIQRALAEDVPVIDGAWLAEVTENDLRRIFRGGNAELQLLDERARIWREVGARLVERYDGRFSNVLASSPRRLYDDGDGFLEVLTRDFPRFDDVATYAGKTVRFWKLAQLSVWILQATLPGGTEFEDLDRLTAFADYIVPAALRVLGITQLLGRARGDDPQGPADRSRLAVGGGDPGAHDLRLRRADETRERAPPAGAPGDRPAGRRAAVGAVPPDALPAPPDAYGLLLDDPPCETPAGEPTAAPRRVRLEPRV